MKAIPNYERRLIALCLSMFAMLLIQGEMETLAEVNWWGFVATYSLSNKVLSELNHKGYLAKFF